MNRHLGHYAVIFNNKKCSENVINDKREFNGRKIFKDKKFLDDYQPRILNGSLARPGNIFNARYGF
jgi:hypothetical protein